MATNIRQKALVRKLIYFGLIVALFTASLIHRKWIVEPQAYALQLRETSRGEVELTGSAVRLMLTGSRGLAVTLLWYNAMEKQKRNEWHELELHVKSITKLQPYFITPWLYQSWNISFNVAVECDRPRDKYYYISRGLELLSEGERRNRGIGDESAPADSKTIVFPGHPEMRHYMGFTYQLKIGTSDERLTMRSLLEMSCIDPVERNPDRFLAKDERGQEIVKLDEFAKFCQNHPRLVRRLREQLTYATPSDIVQFMKDHQKIPSRFKPTTKANQPESELKPPLDQFPILPPKERHWPNPENHTLTSESIDVFLVCRTWYEFAQKPLPPPDTNPGIDTYVYDKLRYRVPKQMVTQLFRQYPARAQVYIAETLESEGFFDRYGWEIRDWFDEMPNRGDEEASIVGGETKYHSRLAWQKGYEMYKDYGIRNIVYIPPADSDILNKKAALFRVTAQAKPEDMPPIRNEWRTGEVGKSLEAHQKLYYSAYYRRLANFDAFFYQAEGESDPITVATRKLLFRAERTRKRGTPNELMLKDYEDAWSLYVLACLKYPRFAQVASMQEDFYEIYQQYLGETQKVHSEYFKKKVLLHAKLPFGPYPAQVLDPSREELDDLVAKFAHWPTSSWREAIARHGAIAAKEMDQQAMNSVHRMRKRVGDLDGIQYYDGPDGNELREALSLWALGAALAPTSALGGAANLNVASSVFPGHDYYLLTRKVSDIEAPVANWPPLINGETRRITANRLGLDR